MEAIQVQFFDNIDIEGYDLSSFFGKQHMLFNVLFDETTFEDEFDAMSLLFGETPVNGVNVIHETSIDFLKVKQKYEEYKLDSDVNKRIQQSQDRRRVGNGLINSHKDDKNFTLIGCHFYTGAIWAALDTNNNELALGFAQRAKALYSFGYYQQAYDDCVCALNLNYPATKSQQIIFIQAACSIKLKDLPKAEKYLAELKVLSVNENNDIELSKLLQAFEELKQEINENVKDFLGEEELELKTKTEECIITGKGRGMRTTCAIKENEFIFSDRAMAFLPHESDSPLCHQCGTTHIIPIPCLNCQGRVKYCSLKCQQEHSAVHQYECTAFRCNIFPDAYDQIFMILRMLFNNGIFSILEDLQFDNKTTTSQIWRELRDGGKIWKNKNIPYANLLRMITHFSKKPLFDQICVLLLSHYGVMYLKEFTNCFEKLNAKNKFINWEHLIGSLLLLHHGQKVANSQGLSAITTVPSKLTFKYQYHMLNANLWKSPWHLKLGRLNLFSNIGDTGSVILPNFSLCNHSCSQLFQVKFCGRSISTYALHDLEKGQELTTCYTPDYRQYNRKTRQSELKRRYHFECECNNCSQPDIEDMEVNKLNNYRCENSNCGQIFVPHENQINWYKIKSPLNCSICDHIQSMKEYYEILKLIPRSSESSIRRCLYEKFKKLEENLLDLNGARCRSARELVYAWFMTILEKKVSFDDQDFIELIDILNYALNYTQAKHNKKSHEYLVLMIYLWDLMAYRKYKVTKIEMDEMLIIIDTILDDNTKKIFINYYNDYIKDYLENKNE